MARMIVVGPMAIALVLAMPMHPSLVVVMACMIFVIVAVMIVIGRSWCHRMESKSISEFLRLRGSGSAA